MKKIKIKNSDDFECMLICAFREQLTRKEGPDKNIISYIAGFIPYSSQRLTRSLKWDIESLDIYTGKDNNEELKSTLSDIVTKCTEFQEHQLVETETELDTDEMTEVILSSLSYCFGRRTYMPSLIERYLEKEILPYLKKETLLKIQNLLAKYENECSINPSFWGDWFDKEDWLKFIKTINDTAENTV